MLKSAIESAIAFSIQHSAFSIVNDAASTASLRISPIRSPPARSSSVRRRSSRSWSRTRSTPARRASRSTIELGGKKLIRVEDDGEGMDPEDARLAIERHATSKIAERRRSRRDSHARVSRRGAAEHRVGLALHAAHARARQRDRAPRSASTAGPSSSEREVGAPEGTSHRGRGSLLQPAGAAEVPQVGHRRSRRRSRGW